MKRTIRNEIFISIFTLPLFFSAILKYGLRILILLLCSVIMGLIIEFVVAKIAKRKTTYHTASVWFLLPLVFPPGMPIWMILVSIFLALLISVVFFGGYGHHLFSPVALGWAIGSLSFSRPFSLGWVHPFPGFVLGKAFRTGMVPLIDHPVVFFNNRGPIPLQSILNGDFPQPISNAIPIITIVLGILLILFNVIDYRTITAFIATSFLFLFVYSFFSKDMPLESILIGNTLFAAFFILADRRIAARTYWGRRLTGILAAILTMVIRGFSESPDGVFYAILLTNIFSALIDEAVLARKFRGVASENI